ncbi:MAG: helix-turn-helix domain-containing protein, partial [Ramlibacter sp.]
QAPLHASEVFAQPWEQLFDAAARESAQAPLEVPLWSGLRLHALPQLAGSAAPRHAVGASALPLKDIEAALIRKAVDDARGNVMKAAQALGISRATVYRKLGRK